MFSPIGYVVSFPGVPDSAREEWDGWGDDGEKRFFGKMETLQRVCMFRIMFNNQLFKSRKNYEGKIL